MSYLAMKEILEKTGTRYRLVIMVAHRARQLTANAQQTGFNPEDDKPIDAALKDVMNGIVTYKEVKIRNTPKK